MLSVLVDATQSLPPQIDVNGNVSVNMFLFRSTGKSDFREAENIGKADQDERERPWSDQDESETDTLDEDEE